MRPVSTRSISTGRSFLTASTMPPTSVRIPRRKTVCRLLSGPANASRNQKATVRVVRAVVFDFDGVLANSEPLHFIAFERTLAEKGVALTERDYYARYLGYNDVGV